ncbi:hypothetical protein, variant [Phytophthora nicotianae CJ01A1]|uniref:Uncharacterized protein n=1 Tax=Phytophthora nicotianae CJ01A1 TaxID=1317063 RepID=W2W8G2_PHYNI|nr:hypothetical protein F441_16824 [Phytophthora nicotianae CJ01A1]ETP06842.1 hypothetical protein, variant [Phytophthora nicotianae CJ01A1]
MPKPNLTDIERKAIIDELLKLSDNGVLPSGVQNKPQRVEHALSFIDDTTLHFEPMTNLLHVDEKWIYADRNWRSYLVFDGEELPPRVWKSKRFIPKTMFLAALARRRYEPHRKQHWDGKIGI